MTTFKVLIWFIMYFTSTEIEIQRAAVVIPILEETIFIDVIIADFTIVLLIILQNTFLSTTRNLFLLKMLLGPPCDDSCHPNMGVESRMHQ